MQLLVDAIEDEKRMFGNTPLTKKEREENAVRERILAIANEIKRSHEAQAEDTYQLPQTYDKNAKGLSDRQKLLKARYKCVTRCCAGRIMLSWSTASLVPRCGRCIQSSGVWWRDECCRREPRIALWLCRSVYVYLQRRVTRYHSHRSYCMYAHVGCNCAHA